MTNKENILSKLREKSCNINGKKDIGVTANDIALELGLKRNVVSHYLNEFVRNGNAIKINTRPVYFLHSDIYQNSLEKFSLANELLNNTESLKKHSEDVFKKLIGYDGSLKNVIDQCKAAVKYPKNGLPILLIGESGVGKSYIAQLIFEYAKQEKIVDAKANFIIFNCAEYADNPELLSATLFGCCKGAYTGAENDRKGLLEEADGGYLLLDEIHRLSPEGQEKLFIFLDKGVFRRVGESGNWRKAKVRLIFATTEKPEKCFLKTFLRRIPLITYIPSFLERPINEKIQLIVFAFKKEAILINRDIHISGKVVNILTNIIWYGNIGNLINTIKFSCAKAFTEDKYNKNDALKIELKDLPQEIIRKFQGSIIDKTIEDIIISKDDREKYNNKIIDKNIVKINNDLIKNIINFRNNDINEEQFLENGSYDNEIIYKILHKKTRKAYDNTTVICIKKIISDNLEIFKANYSIKFYQNTAEMLTNFIIFLCEDTEYNKDEVEQCINFIKIKYKKISGLIDKIINDLEKNLRIKVEEIISVHMILYLRIMNREMKSNLTNAVIMAHGSSTATSIAAVANGMLGSYIFDAFDMPIDVKPESMVNELKKYIKNIDYKKGLILLVDMGSLQEIYLGIKDEFNGDIAIINNLSTMLSLDVGNRIINKQPIELIIKEVLEKNITRCNYIPASDKKKDAIITTCITGIGVAQKIKNLLEQCLQQEDINVFAYDYDRLKGCGEEEYIFNEYNVRLIIGLNDPKIDNIPYISLEDLIMNKADKELMESLNNIIDKKLIEDINNSIVKEFTLENVINHLTILNPDKILTQVQEAVRILELNLGKHFPNSVKISVYIHICCMIERLIMKDPLLEYKNLDKFQQCNGHYIKCAKSAFSVIENFYKIEIPISELAFVYDSINR